MKALIIVDMQNDFCPSGALPVKNGDQIVPLINALQNKFKLIVATKDWHPENHISFASTHNKKVGEVIFLNSVKQVLWPDHCIQGTKGAKLVTNLNTKMIKKTFLKGTNKSIDSYSSFFDNEHKKSTGLGDYLNNRKVTEVYLVGLATDYCIKFTALDALKLGFKTTVIIDACLGINIEKGDTTKSINEMKRAGIKIIHSFELKQAV